MGGIKDISLSVRRAGAGGMLSFAELLSAAAVLKAARRLLNYSSGVYTADDTAEINSVERMISGAARGLSFGIIYIQMYIVRGRNGGRCKSSACGYKAADY